MCVSTIEKYFLSMKHEIKVFFFFFFHLTIPSDFTRIGGRKSLHYSCCFEYMKITFLYLPICVCLCKWTVREQFVVVVSLSISLRVFWGNNKLNSGILSHKMVVNIETANLVHKSCSNLWGNYPHIQQQYTHTHIQKIKLEQQQLFKI